MSDLLVIPLGFALGYGLRSLQEHIRVRQLKRVIDHQRRFADDLDPQDELGRRGD